MAKVKILIVEDEPIIAKDLYYILIDLNYQPVGTAKDVHEAISLIEVHKPDFVLLDINLEGPNNGFYLAEKLSSQYLIPFMFISSLSDKDTLVEARQYLPTGFLVKPIDEHDIKASLEIALYKSEQGININKSNSEPPPFVFLKEGYTLHKVLLKDVLYVEAMDNYSQVITKKKKYTIAFTLKAVQEKFQRWNFIRTHRSYLINPQRIEKITENHIIVENFNIPISRRNKQKLIEILEQF